MRPEAAASLRRPYIYPHRSARMLPQVKRRGVGALAATVVLTVIVWQVLPLLLVWHNAIAFTLLDAAGVSDVTVVETAVFGRSVPAIVPVSGPASTLVSYAWAAVAAAVLLVPAALIPLMRGVLAFVLVLLAISTAAFAAGAIALRRPETLPIVWTHTELLVWLVLPSIAALLFVTVQPSWLRGIGWMLAMQAFAVFWSAARYVVIVGTAIVAGPILLPVLWFAGGLLADVLYVTTFYSLAVHVNLRLTPERRG
jgi:hypothetical protein